MKKFDRPYSTLTPAYGRDYKSAKAAKADFAAGKDFVLMPEKTYIGKDDIKPGLTVKIRYAALREVTTATVK